MKFAMPVGGSIESEEGSKHEIRLNDVRTHLGETCGAPRLRRPPLWGAADRQIAMEIGLIRTRQAFSGTWLVSQPIS